MSLTDTAIRNARSGAKSVKLVGANYLDKLKGGAEVIPLRGAA
jgi:hypothetical protein